MQEYNPQKQPRSRFVQNPWDQPWPAIAGEGFWFRCEWARPENKPGVCRRDDCLRWVDSDLDR